MNLQELSNSFINALKETAKEESKEKTKELINNNGGEEIAEFVSDVVIGTAFDAGFSFLPVIGKPILEYRKNKAIKNIHHFLKLLSERIHILENANNYYDKEKLERIITIATDKVANELQEEKIKHIANGLLNSIEHNFSYDISILYFSILDRITLLEIEILKNYAMPFDERVEFFGRVIQEKFNVTDEGYFAAKNNLLRNGLLDNKTERYLQHDIDKILEAIQDMQEDISKITKYVNSNSKSKLKTKGNKKIWNKTKDSVQITKLGRNFIDYFINENLNR
ncbi:hypothetical protein M1259_11750 [Staphylococcus aureus]|uniref:hypothetical protein n=1 Tax=Staphylococcus aureus TaxID=1280 RepID=UPI002DC01268|nr:hypothetical protein [Staphylococcus aureus]MEB6816930.1 hypothetical protein [Staphylococcus aureus]